MVQTATTKAHKVFESNRALPLSAMDHTRTIELQPSRQRRYTTTLFRIHRASSSVHPDSC